MSRELRLIAGTDVPDNGQPPANPEVIVMLEEALELAKSGHVQSAVVVIMTRQGWVANEWARHESLGVFAMLGAIEQTKKDFQDEEIEPFPGK